MIPRPFRIWSTYKGHTGFDYPYKTGTEIRAGLSGKIIYAAWFNARNGYMKAIDHGNGIVERYYHLENLAGPRVGDYVETGGFIGYTGNSGTASTGPHLHHECWYFGRNQTGMAYWNYIDDKKYVGEESPAGGGGNPWKDDDMSEKAEGQIQRIYDKLFNGTEQDSGTPMVDQLFGNTLDAKNKLSIPGEMYGRPEVIQQRTDTIIGKLETGHGYDWLPAISNQIHGTSDQNAAIFNAVEALSVSGGAADVEALATTIREGLGDEVAEALGRRILNTLKETS